MRSEEVTLSLQEVRWQGLGPVAVEEGQRSREGRCRNTPEGGLGDDASPAWLSLVDGLVEEVIEEQRLELGLAAEGRGDVTEEDGSDDAATAT